MRNEVIEKLNNNNIEVRESDIDIKFLLNSDEVFITNSIVGIMKVIQIENKKFSTKHVENLKKILSL